MISALKAINRVLRQKERGEFTLHVMDTKVLAEEKIFKKISKVLSEVKSDREGEISYGIPYMWNRKINVTNELTKQKETHRLGEEAYGCQGMG